MRDQKKKNEMKSRLFSFLAICIGFILILVGYWIMQRMLEQRQETLLSQSGSVRTVGQEDTEQTVSGQNREKLTEEELVDVLIRHIYYEDLVPHEPYGRQMNMQEAIETGQSWIEEFCSTYSIPDQSGMIQFEGISAQLCTGEMLEDMDSPVSESVKKSNTAKADADDSSIYSKELHAKAQERVLNTQGEEKIESDGLQDTGNPGHELPESMYGYWDIIFSGTDITFNMQIHAVTGQVLQVILESFLQDATAAEQIPLREVLENYVESFDLGGVPRWKGYGSDIYASYESGIGFAASRELYSAEELGYPGHNWNNMFHLELRVVY